MHLVAWLQDKNRRDADVCKAIWEQGVDCLPVSIYCDRNKIAPGIMLGFACAPEIEISKCVATLYKAVMN